MDGYIYQRVKTSTDAELIEMIALFGTKSDLITTWLRSVVCEEYARRNKGDAEKQIKKIFGPRKSNQGSENISHVEADSEFTGETLS